MATKSLFTRTAVAVIALFALLAIAPLAGAEARKIGDGKATPRAGLGGARALAPVDPCARKSTLTPRVKRQLRKLSAPKRRVMLLRERRHQERRAKRCAPARKIGPTGPLYWGAWIGSQLTGTEAPWDSGAIDKFESMAGKTAAVVNFSSPFADCSQAPCSYYDFPAAEMDDIRARGSIPAFSWASQSTPATLNQPEFQLADVLSGSHDVYIREWAEAARDWGKPFFLRFNWEMNGNWFAWSEGVNGNQPGEFVAAWRHVHNIFTAVGATNATWVWCPNVDPHDKLQDLAPLYPGDAYVDWTGLDGYNWGTNPASPKGWMSFDELFRATYDEIVETIAPHKPMIISEVGSSEYGGSKAAWIADALASARTNYPQLRGLLWFEKYDDGMDWPIETSSNSAAAFASGIGDPAYIGNSLAGEAAGKIQPFG